MEQKIKVIGVTGQSGSGKTTLSRIIHKEYNLPIIIADQIARQVVEPNTPALKELEDAFGSEIIAFDGTLNRQKLAEIVFSNPEKKLLNESIVFPYIIDVIKGLIVDYDKKGFPFVILDAPTLFESGVNSICYKTIGVVAESSYRLERIMTRDNISESKAEQRNNAQKPDSFYREQVDYLLENNGSLVDFMDKAQSILAEIGLK